MRVNNDYNFLHRKIKKKKCFFHEEQSEKYLRFLYF